MAEDDDKPKGFDISKLEYLPDNDAKAEQNTVGCVSNLVEILWRRSPSMGIWA
ncbi:MAG: hypothetical protein K8F59_15335 [Rhodobacteraceae bacterium]|nr:hypothetical protein [Paracoccaceae bacterium]